MDEIKTTPIFKRLKKLDKAFAYKVLENTNAIVELINKKTTINFPNYTNHDIHHSINIINFMYELIKKNIDDFNALELALMIYSAMYHDIGMALDDNEIEKIKSNESKYLYKKDFASIKNSNNDDENLALQEIIRVSHGKIANDLITTKYKDNFNFLNSSINFAKELGQICEAHTRDKDYLNNIKQKDTKGTYDFNARFISVLLRVADILDIDANRTPLELYNAMNLNNYSDDEWHKNFSISNTKKIFIKNKRKYVKLNGECSDIKIHRKLLEYIKWIENELKLAVDTSSEMEEKYQIDIRTEVENNIEANGYTIPDLKLNMDYHAVTNLLMGESIYGSKDMGLRELIQNSIDACMVKKEKLDKENPNHNYNPTIDINIDEKNNQVIIEDNGMGMNEHIIKNYFLNVGKSYYKSKDFLDYKHEYSPIGNFGIGFLSCFMLSPEVKVITKYYGESKKYEIEVEQNSEYISFNKEDESIWESGTKIVLNYESVKSVFKNDNLEERLEKFIKRNILINTYCINLNNNKIKQEEIIKADYHIKLSDYCTNIEGYIILKNHRVINNNNLISSYFYDSNTENFIKLNYMTNYKDISTNLMYLQIFLQNSDNYINLFIPSNIFHYGKLTEKKDRLVKKNEDRILYEIKYNGRIFHDENYILNSSILFSSLNELENVLEIYVKYRNLEVVIDKTNYSICDSYQYGRTTNYKCYFKNIKINSLSCKSLNILSVKDSLINIKNNQLALNVSRKELLKDSRRILNKTIEELVLRYVLDNFDLTPEEKILVQKFIDEYYPEKSILLK